MMPAPVPGLTGNDRQQELLLEQGVQALSRRGFESLQRDIQRVGFILGADLPLVAPLETVFVNKPVDEIPINIRGATECGVRAPHEHRLHLEYQGSLQGVEEIAPI